MRRFLKRLVPKSLFGRALIIIVAPVLLSQSILSYIFVERHWETVTRRLCYMLATDMAYVVELVDPTKDNSGNAAALKAAEGLQMTLTVTPRGHLPKTVQGPYPMVERVLHDQLDSAVARPLVIDTVHVEDEIVTYVDMGGAVATLETPLKRITTSTTELLLFWMLGLSVVLTAVAIVFLRGLVRPILRLTSAAEAFGRGLKVDDFKPAGAMEVRRAAAAFIAMRQRIDRYVRQRTDMLSGISHDLRTPLTRMKLRMALMPPGDDRDEMLRDVQEMEYMAGEFLAFAHGEEGEAAATFDLAALLDEIAEEAEIANPEVPVECRTSREVVVSMRRHSFKRAIVNLVRNGQRYGSGVHIALVEMPRSIEIMVDDDGPGIPRELRSRAFRPFVRLDVSRPPDDAGVGLGLAIARDIVRSHGGDIFLETAPTGGLRVRIRLPL